MALTALSVGGFVFHTMTYFKRNMSAVWRAGFAEKQVTINGSNIHYAEGPANGLPLLLVHGQAVDWQNYARVLPALADHYHVFALDCYGHGRSARVPEKYAAAALGNAEDRRARNLQALVVVETRIDEGPMFKRVMPGSRGMAALIKRRMCHIHVKLDALHEEEPAVAGQDEE